MRPALPLPVFAFPGIQSQRKEGKAGRITYFRQQSIEFL